MTVDFIAELAAARVLAIIRGTDTAATVAAGKALLEEGVRLVEVSLTTPGAPRAIEAIRSDAPAGSLVGAGTVLTVSAVADVADVAAAGAQFIVTPALVESIADAARRGLPVPDSGRGTRPERPWRRWPRTPLSSSPRLTTWPAACVAGSRSAPSPFPPTVTGKACRAATNWPSSTTTRPEAPSAEPSGASPQKGTS
jgi:hypothetical protein